MCCVVLCNHMLVCACVGLRDCHCFVAVGYYQCVCDVDTLRIVGVVNLCSVFVFVCCRVMCLCLFVLSMCV